MGEPMTEDMLTCLKKALAAREEVIWAYLFGSRARGLAGPGSDWDVAVWFARMEAFARLTSRLDLQSHLADILGAPVDLVDLNEASPLLCHEVLRGRIVLVDKDPVARAIWELKATGEYLDWLPYHRRYAKHLLQDLMGKGGVNRGPGRGGESPWLATPIHQGTPGRTERQL